MSNCLKYYSHPWRLLFARNAEFSLSFTSPYSVCREMRDFLHLSTNLILFGKKSGVLSSFFISTDFVCKKCGIFLIFHPDLFCLQEMRCIPKLSLPYFVCRETYLYDTPVAARTFQIAWDTWSRLDDTLDTRCRRTRSDTRDTTCAGSRPGTGI